MSLLPLHPPTFLQCRDVCGLNTSDRCDFIRTNPDCRSEGGYLDYLEGIFCHFPPSLLPLAITLYVRPCWGAAGGAGGRGRWAGPVAQAGLNLSLSGPTQAFWMLYLFLILGVTAEKL